MASVALNNPLFTFSSALPSRRTEEKNTLVDIVYPQIFDAILEQRIATTSRFTEASLAEAFGVSRSVIRQVLERLAHQQVILLRPNHRPRVIAPDVEQTRQTLHARRLVETTLIRLACQQPPSAHLQRLYELIARERDSAQQRQRGPALRLSGEFHLQLAEVAGNAPLAQFLDSLVPLTSLAMALIEDQPSLRIWEEHRCIVEAVEQGDAKAAVRLMSAHLDHLEQRLIRSN